jgi:hypothetical protein
LNKDLTEHDSDPCTDVLDHSRELVEIVSEAAVREYRSLVRSGRFRREIDGSNRFNYGKVFAYAEYCVFRREYQARFPRENSRSCINAYCRLFLKNDISMSNLIRFVEGEPSDELKLLNR